MDINPFEVLKNAQKIQEQMGALQEKLAALKVTGSAGGGMVEIDLNGKMETLGVRIEEDVFAGGDRELVQGLIASAFTDGAEKVKELVSRELGAMSGLPGMTGLPGFPGFPGAAR